MAASIIPENTQTAVSLDFTTTPGIYRFCDDVTSLSLEDQITAKQIQLQAMLQVGTDVRGDAVDVNAMSEYMWACQATVLEIGALTREFIARTKKAK